MSTLLIGCTFIFVRGIKICVIFVQLIISHTVRVDKCNLRPKKRVETGIQNNFTGVLFKGSIKSLL
ncbi:hypothetical protein CT694_33560 (plasmid) [Bacillus wiedmannii bv. thuringiensis]|nr:hypothetical protein CT694_33560 [Bacillus wiedmannii bv. thuringiensis]